MFENITLDGLIAMGQVTIVTLAVLCTFLAVAHYMALKPVPKRKRGRPAKK